jgi:hypothetical protein
MDTSRSVHTNVLLTCMKSCSPIEEFNSNMNNYQGGYGLFLGSFVHIDARYFFFWRIHDTSYSLHAGLLGKYVF